MSMGSALSEQMAQKVGEIKQAVAGISDEQASKPKGEEEWCVKEVLSHLCGDTDALSMYEFKRFLEEENPELGIVPGRLGGPRRGGPLGEYPTLGQWAGAVINVHMADHVNQLRTLAQ